MADFCSHFGVQAALPRRPISASLDQGPSKLDQSARQMDRFGPKGAPGQNISIYYVLELLGWALETIRRLKSTFRGFTRGNDSLVAAQRARGSFGIYGNGRK